MPDKNDNKVYYSPGGLGRIRPRLHYMDAVSVDTRNAEHVTSASVHSDSQSSISSASKRNADNRRSEGRQRILWPATLTVGSHDFSCQVWDISLGGARVRCEIPLRKGAFIKLSFMDKPALPSRIIWVRENSMGINFCQSKAEICEILQDKLDNLEKD